MPASMWEVPCLGGCGLLDHYDAKYGGNIGLNHCWSHLHGGA